MWSLEFRTRSLCRSFLACGLAKLSLLETCQQFRMESTCSPTLNDGYYFWSLCGNELSLQVPAVKVRSHADSQETVFRGILYVPFCDSHAVSHHRCLPDHGRAGRDQRPA